MLAPAGLCGGATRSAAYSLSGEGEHEELVRCDGGEWGEDSTGKIRAAKWETVGQDDGAADAGALLREYAVGVGRSGSREGIAARASDGAVGEADGVSERRPATEEFANGEEPSCDGRTELGQGTRAVIWIDRQVWGEGRGGVYEESA